ncbi:hypothetical protein SMSP2_02910 [Limihaloglobus sulfuriphilus]|uniref:Uncharacterized protein n=1 Tax=Limihaloglobus sulfuriphilus TaxID=1851148 RepID=A0A1Q2MIN3_9BACT|nr:hypothetical protein [Limihaloglobus sulfuriphilus]AQQ72524.1 hypothetical protein SMSP2_02910 [Limihaloglobus sulfuriphilus]
MKLPEINNPRAFKSLYAIDFGEYSSVGFTGREVAELLESERYRGVKVYRIHNARPDGTMELKGVQRETFELESGMFFYADDEDQARQYYNRLVEIALKASPPERAKVHLAKTGDSFAAAIIYPAEADADFADWLKAAGYMTSGFVEGGMCSVSRYYHGNAEILESRQLFAADEVRHRSGEELLADIRKPLQRYA